MDQIYKSHWYYLTIDVALNKTKAHATSRLVAKETYFVCAMKDGRASSPSSCWKNLITQKIAVLIIHV